MTFLVRRFIVLLLFFETLIFLVLYFFGPKGFNTLIGLRHQQQQVIGEIDLLQKEIKALQLDIEAGLSSFSKEKIAREKLLMKKDQELIYFKTK